MNLYLPVFTTVIMQALLYIIRGHVTGPITNIKSIAQLGSAYTHTHTHTHTHAHTHTQTGRRHSNNSIKSNCTPNKFPIDLNIEKGNRLPQSQIVNLLISGEYSRRQWGLLWNTDIMGSIFVPSYLHKPGLKSSTEDRVLFFCGFSGQERT